MRKYKSVIIGIRTDTATVEKVWIQNDGGMSDGGRVHYPSGGKTAAGETIIVFGLTRFREFSVDDGDLAMAYAALLRTALSHGEAANDDPSGDEL
jgi:hypothetical protein